MRLLATVFVLAFASKAVAQPADPVDACIAAADRAQKERDGGKLKAARESLLVCAAESCPSPIQTDCVKWLEEVETAAPSVVFRVTDSNGKELTDAKIDIDGVDVENALSGHALAVDPGERTFRCTLPGRPPIEQRVVIRQGEKARAIDFVVKVTAPPLATQPKPRVLPPLVDDRKFEVPTLSYVLAGVGVVGGVGFAVLAFQAKHERDDLRDTCAPSCAESDVDSARTKMILADVSLGVGVVALGAAAWLTWDHNRERPVSAGFAPLPGGGAGAISGRF